MAKRALVGLLKGLLVGALTALAWAKLGKSADFTGVPAYALAAITGALIGSIAGKPFWAKGALTEVALKTGVGAMFASAALYGIKKWLNVALDFSVFGIAVNDAPAVLLSTLAVVLGIVFELDNTEAEPVQDRSARIRESKAQPAERQLSNFEAESQANGEHAPPKLRAP